MERGFSWEGISQPINSTEGNKKEEVIDDISRDLPAGKSIEQNNESNFETPGVIEGEIKERENGLVNISTEFGELKIPEDKFQNLFGDKKDGKIVLTPLDIDDVAVGVLNKLLISQNE